MPKSKRDKKVSLTQTRKKGLELKQGVVEEIRACCDKYARVFTWSAHNMRNAKLKDVRTEWRHSRFHFGKNKLVGLALGKTPADEYKEGLSEVAKRLWGQKGLLFTNSTKEEVLAWFGAFAEPDFARAGTVATQTVRIPAGALPELGHSMEPQLRALGLPTTLERGVITMQREHVVCEASQKLSPEQCRVLKLFGHQMARFQLEVECMWQNDGTFEEFETSQGAAPETLPSVTIRPTGESREDSAGEEMDDEAGDQEEDSEE